MMRVEEIHLDKKKKKIIKYVECYSLCVSGAQFPLDPTPSPVYVYYKKIHIHGPRFFFSFFYIIIMYIIRKGTRKIK